MYYFENDYHYHFLRMIIIIIFLRTILTNTTLAGPNTTLAGP